MPSLTAARPGLQPPTQPTLTARGALKVSVVATIVQGRLSGSLMGWIGKEW
jgi:hypothetical protein